MDGVELYKETGDHKRENSSQSLSTEKVKQSKLLIVVVIKRLKTYSRIEESVDKGGSSAGGSGEGAGGPGPAGPGSCGIFASWAHALPTERRDGGSGVGVAVIGNTDQKSTLFTVWL